MKFTNNMYSMQTAKQSIITHASGRLFQQYRHVHSDPIKTRKGRKEKKSIYIAPLYSI